MKLKGAKVSAEFVMFVRLPYFIESYYFIYAGAREGARDGLVVLK